MKDWKKICIFPRSWFRVYGFKQRFWRGCTLRRSFERLLYIIYRSDFNSRAKTIDFFKRKKHWNSCRRMIRVDSLHKTYTVTNGSGSDPSEQDGRFVAPWTMTKKSSNFGFETCLLVCRSVGDCDMIWFLERGVTKNSTFFFSSRNAGWSTVVLRERIQNLCMN